ncbi:MAG: hypothetical protein LEGION0398_MBIBDBAK_01337 [Legionellaceae bacterium]
MGGNRGRLITAEDRQESIELIMQVCRCGARKKKACEIMGISMRTLERWQKTNTLLDQRKTVKRLPKNKLTIEERDKVLTLANQAPYRDLPPCKIVPLLANEGKYLARLCRHF